MIDDITKKVGELIDIVDVITRKIDAYIGSHNILSLLLIFDFVKRYNNNYVDKLRI